MAETRVSYLESSTSGKCKCLAQMAVKRPSDRERLCARCDLISHRAAPRQTPVPAVTFTVPFDMEPAEPIAAYTH